MKKFCVVILMILTVFSIYADTNEKWFHKNGYGILHNTWDYAIINSKEGTMLFSEDFEEDDYVSVCFSDEIVEGELILMVAYDEKFVPEKIQSIAYGDDLDNITDSFTPAYTSSNGFSLNDKDSKFLYYDMLYTSQKIFVVFTENYMLLFNVNCKNLYKYGNYLF